MKRREKKEENYKKKRSKNYWKKKKPKNEGAPRHNCYPKILPGGSAKLRWAGRGTGDLLFHSLCGPVERKNPWYGRPKFDIFYIYCWGSNKKQRSCDEQGGGGRAAPRLACQWAQKDGCAQRTGAHARPKPTSTKNNYLTTPIFTFFSFYTPQYYSMLINPPVSYPPQESTG